MTEHTPGPWRATPIAGHGTFIEGDYSAVTTSRPTVAHMTHNNNDTRAHADAHLIAAAPDLLAACEAFAAPGTPVSASVIEMAREAIRKAREG